MVIKNVYKTYKQTCKIIPPNIKEVDSLKMKSKFEI